MPRLHQRMRCRRGSTRGQPLCTPSNPSTKSFSHSIDYYVGRYPNTRSGQARVLGSSHRMGSPAPHFPTASPSLTTRTALFSFNFSLNRPRITASITVVFREEVQVEEQCTRPAGLSSEKAQLSGLQEGSSGVNVQEPKAQVRRACDVEIAPGDPGPSMSEAAPAMDSDIFAEGWCRIVEERMDE